MVKLSKILLISIFISLCSVVELPFSPYIGVLVENNQPLDFELDSLISSEGEPYNTSQLSNYTLSVILHETHNIVEGNLTVDYYNNDNVEFGSIPFHLYPSGMQYDVRPGNIEILNVTTTDEPKINLDYVVFADIQIMWVNLTSAIQPSERVSFEISFNSTFADGGYDRCNAYGWDINSSRIFKWAAAYPMICVYDHDGWNTDPYLDVGDPFYSDMAWYNFSIKVPNEMVIAATGELIDRKIGINTTNYNYNPKFPVREVTFSASRYFIVESQMIEGVNISVYYIPKSITTWQNYAIDYAKKSFNLFNTNFGQYPYPTYNVVEEYTSFGGMEYPLQVYITEKADDNPYPQGYLEAVIVHETAHQWFYQLLGNDQVETGFLDEGITCWASEWYTSIYHPDWGDGYGAFSQIDYVMLYNNYTGSPNRINQSVYESALSGANYWFTAYTKTPVILEKLRQTIGHDNFIDGIGLLFDRFQFKHIWLSDVQDVFEDTAGINLDWFFFPWFDNNYLPKYSFENVSYGLETRSISFMILDESEDHNEYEYSQQIPLIIYDESDNIILNEKIWVNGTTSFNFTVNSKPLRLEMAFTSFTLAQINSIDEKHVSTENIQIIDARGTIAGLSTGIVIFNAVLGISVMYLVLNNRKKILRMF